MAPRICYYIPVGQVVEGKGYIPSVVTEGEPDHTPLVGRGEFSEPWYWGQTYEQACKTAATANLGLGLTPDDVEEIVESSVVASMQRDGRRRVAMAKLHPQSAFNETPMGNLLREIFEA